MQSIKGEPALTFYKANHIPPPLFFSLVRNSIPILEKKGLSKLLHLTWNRGASTSFCPILFLMGFLRNCRRKYWRWESQVNKIEKSKRQSVPMLNSREVSFRFFPPFTCFMDPGSQKKTELILHHFAFPVL